MSWSYPASPANPDRDAVRLLIGDTDAADQQLSDETLDAVLALFPGDVASAAAYAAEALCARYSRYYDKSVGPLRVAKGQIAQHYRDLAGLLWQKSGGQPVGLTGIYAGGISVADVETRDRDDDRVKPRFTRDSLTSQGVPPTPLLADEEDL